MCVSVVLAHPDPIPEVIVAGRQSSSVRSLTLSPIVFSKAGAQTAVALPEKHYNTTDANQRIQKVVASLGTAPAGSAFVVDCKINSTSVFAAAGDRASIAAGATVSTGGVPNKDDVDTAVVKPGQYVTVEVTQIGSGTAGSDLRVQVQLGG